MEKLKIIVIEGSANGAVVEGQFNPKEITIQKSVPWEQQSMGGPSDIKYTHTLARTMSFELLFDGFSTATSIQGEIDKLQALTDIDTSLQRPPKLRVVWGPEALRNFLPKFEAVIEELVVKYTMFDPDGKPLRATAGLRLKEARHVRVDKSA